MIFIMFSVVLVVEAITIGILFQTGLGQEKARLVETAKSQARLIEAVARFDRTYNYAYPHGARQATLSQLVDAHARYRGFGDTGEFTLATRENDQIVFLLSHRHHDLDQLRPVPWNSGLAEPMRLALSGKSGTIIGMDYRGERVLAAYEPVAELGYGIVAKIDYSEIKKPYLRAALISGIMAVFVIGSGVGFFFKVTNPILNRLRETVENLEKALLEVKTLRGILPICSFCKKIRDDNGYWNQLEVYIKARSDADFSHSLCPDCLERHYPEEHALLRGEK
ncbi:hypothetical protein ACUUL3_16525 [Thiovibrio sp. JS02]